MFKIRKLIASKILPVLLAAAMLSGSFSAPVFATENDEPVAEIIAQDELCENENDELQEEQPDDSVTDVSGSTQTDSEETNAEEPGETDEILEEHPDEPEDEDETSRILEAAGFTELDEDIELTEEQVASKEKLADHAEEIESCEVGEDYVENEIVVSAENEDEALLYAKAYNAELVHFDYGIGLLRLKPEAAELGEMEPDTDMVSLAVSISSDPDINLPAAWPNYCDELLDEPTDKDEFADYSMEYKDDQLYGKGTNYQWYHETIGTNAAWRAGYKGQDVKVVVIDSGTTDHEDVEWKASERVVPNSDFTDFEIDSNARDSIATSECGHGTSVSGIIGETAGNGVGGAGIAPLCDLYMINVMTGNKASANAYTESIAVGEAVNKYNADVINISIGGVTYAEYFENAINNAYENGIAVVCASGNDGISASRYPASYTGAISVGATNRANERTDFSNFGQEVRYGAPGKNILSARPYSSYKNVDGTSVASPVIAGMIAVLFSSGKVEGTGADRVDNVLKMLDGSCTYSGEGIGKGVPNLARALGLDTDDGVPAPPKFSRQSGTYTDASIEIELTTQSSGSGHANLIYYSDNGANVTFTNGAPSANAKRYDPAEKITVTGKRTTVIKAIAVNPSNGLVSKQVSCTYTLKPLVSNIAVSTETGQFKLQKGQSLLFTAKLTPFYAANTGVTYEVIDKPIEAGPKTSAYISGSRLYAPAAVVPGKYSIRCTSKDADGKHVDFDVIVENPDEKVYSIAASKTSLTMYAGIDENLNITLTTIEGKIKYIRPAEAYTVLTSSDEDVLSAVLDGNTLKITGKKAGKATIKISAKDGTKVSRSITVNVRTHPVSVSVNPVTGGKVAYGKSVKLTANVLPADAYNKGVTWSIDQDRLPVGATKKTSATIGSSTGVFSASKATPGPYWVIATAKDKNNAGNTVIGTYKIEVTNDLTKSITISKKSTSIFRVKNAYGSPTSDKIDVIMSGGSYNSLSVTSSNPGVATAALSQDEDGIHLVVRSTARSTGNARITVKTNDGTGKNASVSVTVSNPPSYLELSVPSGCYTKLAKGRSMKLSAKIGTSFGKPAASSQKIKWSSNKTGVISCDQNGNITAKVNTGESATITASILDGSISTSILITSVANTTSITTDGLWKRMVSGGKYYGEYIDSIFVGKYGYLSLENTTNVEDGYLSSICKNESDVIVDKSGLTVIWSSATRESGKPNATIALYANKPGTYTVTIKMRDKSSATKKIKVTVVEKKDTEE